MAGPCLLRPKNIGAITVLHFLEALQRTWRESSRNVVGRGGATPDLPRRLGLAVSGGADSMALAYLCKQWERQRDSLRSPDGVSVTAFVVDHKARKESSQEAHIVAQWLNEMRIQTQVLELKWPEGGLSNMSAFETHARRLRFQALGTACRDHQIEALLMGHHQDDNVETTIWRLSSGARGAGLAGIPPVARIPECHGLYGVSESGSITIIHPNELTGSEPQVLNPRRDEERTTAPVPISTGGISILRPLLTFPKSRLVDTCHKNGVPFVSDPTNFDPTLTPRNSIRSLLASNSFPRALQSSSILSLIDKSHYLIQDSIHLSNELLEQCQILNLTLATGSIKLQFPTSLQTTTTKTNLKEASPHLSTLSPTRLQQIQSLTLRRITELISPFPENHFPLRSFQSFTQHVFPSSSASTTKQTPFTLGGVIFHPQPPTTNPDYKSTHTETLKANTTTWLLSRQPFMRHRLPTLTYPAPIPSSLNESESESKETFPSEQGEKGEDTDKYAQPKFTPWSLWDNRYWFRFAVIPVRRSDGSHHPCSEPPVHETTSVPTGMGGSAQVLPLIVRPLQQSDLRMPRRRQKIKGKGHEQGHSRHHLGGRILGAALDKLERDAPGQSRFTVPLLCVDKAFAGTDGDLLLALPTMGLWLVDPTELQEAYRTPTRWTIKWEWKYKMIDTQVLRLMGTLNAS